LGSKSKKGAAKPWAQWLVYTEELPVIERLDEVDLNWTWKIDDKTVEKDWAVVYGTMTVCGVSRSSNGDGGAHGEAPDGNMEKGAQTDALKRTARLFGVGEYLQKAPRLYTDWKDDPSRDEEAAFAKQAMAKFETWFNQQFPPAKAAPKPTEPRTPMGREPKPVSKADASAEPPDDDTPMPMPTLDDAKPRTGSTADIPNDWATPAQVDGLINWAQNTVWKAIDWTDEMPHLYNRIANALGFSGDGTRAGVHHIVLHLFTGSRPEARRLIQMYEPKSNPDLEPAPDADPFEMK
jgi:hypothetical protein